jgi:rod shape determining protein RodA
MIRVRDLDFPLIVCWAALLAYGLATLYSAGQTDFATPVATLWKRQIIWAMLGLAGAVITFRLSPRIVEWGTPAVYAIGLALLALALVVGTGAGTAASSRSWLAIGGVRLGQPAEFAKLATILMMARYLATWREPPTTLRGLVPACLIVGAPFLLIAAQPDLGSAIVFVGILFAMLFWAGVRASSLFLLASPVASLILAFSTAAWSVWIVLLFVLLIRLRPYVWEGLTVMLVNVVMGVIALPFWQRMPSYQQNRLLAFLDPEVDPRAAGWHVIQSKVAIGSGGFLGQGFTDGPQKRLAFLPAQHTDFIFSVVGEELGFLGVFIALGLFATLILVLVRIARRAPDAFGSLVVFGVTGMLFTHLFENVGMTLNLMPVTGIPLPFFSYGGSFLIIVSVALALCLRVARESRRPGYLDM